MDKFSHNPFDRSAITDYRLLAGRGKELDQVRFALRVSSISENRVKNMLITGNRGVGKTSFLNIIELDCPLFNIVPVRVNVTEEMSLNSHEFFWQVFNQVLNKVFDLDIMGGHTGEVSFAVQNMLNAQGLADPVNWLFKMPIQRRNYLMNGNISFDFEQLVIDLKLIRNQICTNKKFNGKTKVLFLVDEAQGLYSNKGLVEALRFIMLYSNLGIGFVFAGDSSYESSIWENVFGGSHREFEIIRLGYFEDAEAVEEYFKKSLQAIGWTDEDTGKFFYRIKKACADIQILTSGKPAWINTIAAKMFERCMKGESKLLKFDRPAQADVKSLLKGSEEFDTAKIEYIEQLSIKEQKWIAVIFNCELSTLSQVYFYTKFKYPDEFFMDREAYNEFCQRLVDNKIVTLLYNDDDRRIGFKMENKTEVFMGTRYLALHRYEAIKQWLQISTDGLFSFGWAKPIVTYVQYISKELSKNSRSYNILVVNLEKDEKAYRAKDLLDNLVTDKSIIADEPYKGVQYLYKLVKNFKDSQQRQIMFGVLKNEITGKVYCWNTYVYDEKAQIADFNYSTEKLERLKANVERFNNETTKWTLQIEIDKIRKYDIHLLQEAIIETDDRNKMSIVVDDKSGDLVDHYLKDKNLEYSYEDAIFLYKLYEMGFELDIGGMNNMAYIYIVKEELEKAKNLLNECDLRYNRRQLEKSDRKMPGLVKYNLAIIEAMEGNYISAHEGFVDAMNFCNENADLTFTAGALHKLEKDDCGNLAIIEFKEYEKRVQVIDFKMFAEENIEILESMSVLNIGDK